MYALSNSFANNQHIQPFGLAGIRTSAPVAVYHWLMVFLKEKVSGGLSGNSPAALPERNVVFQEGSVIVRKFPLLLCQKGMWYFRRDRIIIKKLPSCFAGSKYGISGGCWATAAEVFLKCSSCLLISNRCLNEYQNIGGVR